jgi:tRNA dimethylallyltransferase
VSGGARPPVVLLGPTASGKSDVAMAVARAANEAAGRTAVEIVACDAMQVYRGMDVGTAKPSAADRAAVPHHCLDLAEPGERGTVADYQAAARGAMAGVDARGARALIVAGTGLYLTAVIDDLELPGEWPEVRAALEAEPDPAVLLARLAELDPPTAAKVDPSNRRRIERALEVCIGSGRAFSSFGPGTAAYPDRGVVQIGILWPREALAARIEARVRAMLAAGLVAEVRASRRAGRSRARPARRSGTARSSTGGGAWAARRAPAPSGRGTRCPSRWWARSCCTRGSSRCARSGGFAATRGCGGCAWSATPSRRWAPSSRRP